MIRLLQMRGDPFVAGFKEWARLRRLKVDIED